MTWVGGFRAPTPVYPLLVAGMVILGFGESAYAPTADLVPLELAPPGLAGRYTAVHQLAWGVSGAVAPIRVYAFEWGDLLRILGGWGRLGQVTPPACSRTRSL